MNFTGWKRQSTPPAADSTGGLRPGANSRGGPDAVERTASSRFKLLVAGGIGALMLQAWLASPEEMLVFGLPLFVLAVGGYRLVRMLPADDAAPRSPATLGPVRKALAILLAVLLVAGFVYIVVGRVGDSGFVGWLDAVQMRHGGRYREKTSLVTAACDLLIAYGLGMAAVLRIGRRP
jgi:hypothetical protein